MLRSLFALSLCVCALTVSALPTSSTVPSYKLNNGVEMPIMAFGANVWDADTCKNATGLALEAGFRFIWSSTLVGADCQKAQAEAIAASGISKGASAYVCRSTCVVVLVLTRAHT